MLEPKVRRLRSAGCRVNRLRVGEERAARAGTFFFIDPKIDPKQKYLLRT